MKAATLLAFVERNCEPGSTIHTDGLQACKDLANLGYEHDATNVSAGNDPAHVAIFGASGGLGSQVPAISSTVTALLPDWMAYQLRVESDALLATATNPHVDRGYGTTTNRANKVVDHVPSTALALVAGNDASFDSLS